jgi:hypothetical protein
MNCLDEKFDMLKCMDEINSKTIMLDQTTCTSMKVTKWMKYLDKHGTWMNFWMIIGSKQFFGWNFQLVECMDESNFKTIMTNGNY